MPIFDMTLRRPFRSASTHRASASAGVNVGEDAVGGEAAHGGEGAGGGHGVGAVADERGQVVHLARLAALHEQARARPPPGADQVVMHGGHGQEHGHGHAPGPTPWSERTRSGAASPRCRPRPPPPRRRGGPGRLRARRLPPWRLRPRRLRPRRLGPASHGGRWRRACACGSGVARRIRQGAQAGEAARGEDGVREVEAMRVGGRLRQEVALAGRGTRPAPSPAPRGWRRAGGW